MLFKINKKMDQNSRVLRLDLRSVARLGKVLDPYSLFDLHSVASVEPGGFEPLLRCRLSAAHRAQQVLTGPSKAGYAGSGSTRSILIIVFPLPWNPFLSTDSGFRVPKQDQDTCTGAQVS